MSATGGSAVTVSAAVAIEIDGREVPARRGQMIIEVADAAGITIPRFCYHNKLSIAANCRMCLVEVDGVKKPMPACATPIAPGMKVRTRSALAQRAQQGVMEFLLINHPLDCPICDQGGECELQDVALQYGRDASRFSEGKRVVVDKDLGPLISSDMTRCIHCTRCVRFGTEIAGIRELGATGRGEHTEIGTYIERSVDSELSGNVIDLCPVGALTSKPYRFTARAWELTQRSSIAPHDAVGSNLYLHVRRGEVMRVVPRACEPVNEVWISDRDRYSYQGLMSPERLHTPMLREEGRWREASWDEALGRAVQGLRAVQATHGPEQLGVLAAPTATLEELFLLARLTRALGSANIDHRLRQTDFRDQAQAPLFPGLGQSLADLEQLDHALLVGTNIRQDLPLVAHRLRQATRRGATVALVSALDQDPHLPVASRLIVPPSALPQALAGIARALIELRGEAVPGALAPHLTGVEVADAHRGVAAALHEAVRATVLLGSLALGHPAAATVRGLASAVADLGEARLGYLPEAVNSAGAWLAGVVPHREAGGGASATVGLDAASMLRDPRRAYLLLGLEPDLDTWDPPTATAALGAAECTVALSAYRSEALLACADVLLPMCPFSETSGTFVNLEGRWQSFEAAVAPAGASRPGWKVLRVLGNRLELPEFEYEASTEIRAAVRECIGEHGIGSALATGAAAIAPTQSAAPTGGELERIGAVPPYAVDALVRRAPALQQTRDGEAGAVRICQAQAVALGLEAHARARVLGAGAQAVLPLRIDERVPEGCAWIPAALAATRELGPAFGTVRLARG